MRNLPAWIPTLNSWMSAVLLAAIVSIGTNIATQIYGIFAAIFLFFYFAIVFLLSFLAPIWNFLLRLFSLLPGFIQSFIVWIFQLIFLAFSYIFSILTTISSPLLLIVPIVVIAFSHHYLHLFLDRFFPDIRLPEMEKVNGFFPSIMSWWEGFYGLLVIIVSLLLSDIFLSFCPFLAFNSDLPTIEPANTGRLFYWFYFALALFTQPIYSPIARFFVWIIAAAYLYQFESTVRQHLIAVGSRLGSINNNAR